MLHLTKKFVFMYKIEKMPDKISRLATSFVRHFIYFKRKTGLFVSSVRIILLIFEPVQGIRSFRQMILWHLHTHFRTSL